MVLSSYLVIEYFFFWGGGVFYVLFYFGRSFMHILITENLCENCCFECLIYVFAFG